MARSNNTLDTITYLAGTTLPPPARIVLGNSTLFRLTIIVLIVGLTLGIISLSWENGTPSLRLDRVKLNQYKDKTLQEIKNLREGKPLGTAGPQVAATNTNQPSGPNASQQGNPAVSLGGWTNSPGSAIAPQTSLPPRQNWNQPPAGYTGGGYAASNTTGYHSAPGYQAQPPANPNAGYQAPGGFTTPQQAASSWANTPPGNYPPAYPAATPPAQGYPNWSNPAASTQQPQPGNPPYQPAQNPAYYGAYPATNPPPGYAPAPPPTNGYGQPYPGTYPAPVQPAPNYPPPSAPAQSYPQPITNAGVANPMGYSGQASPLQPLPNNSGYAASPGYPPSSGYPAGAGTTPYGSSPSATVGQTAVPGNYR
ncbi:MAG: hypothetical protein SFX18_02050 [Pirellulales bacterium]|nr:hypothetical protein [Pirellulales bacterium]